MKTIKYLYALFNTSNNRKGAIENKPVVELPNQKPVINNVVPCSTSDYLKDTVIDKNILNMDPTSFYTDMLEYESISKYDKKIISTFLMPYRISILKYGFNKEFYSRPEFGRLSITELTTDNNDYEYISPSLRFIAMNPAYHIKIYPDFFFIAFPDVACWALNRETLKINGLLGFYRELGLTSNKFLSNCTIKKIIDLYIKTTNKELECSIIKHRI